MMICEAGDSTPKRHLMDLSRHGDEERDVVVPQIGEGRRRAGIDLQKLGDALRIGIGAGKRSATRLYRPVPAASGVRRVARDIQRIHLGIVVAVEGKAVPEAIGALESE